MKVFVYETSDVLMKVIVYEVFVYEMFVYEGVCL